MRLPHFLAAVAAEIGRIPRRVAKTSEAQIAAYVAKIMPEIGAVTSQIAAIGVNIASIGTDVRPMSISAGRCHRRGESGTADGQCSRKYQNQFTNHDDQVT